MEKGLVSLYDRLGRSNKISRAEVRDTLKMKGLSPSQQLQLLDNIKEPLKDDSRSEFLREREQWALVLALPAGSHMKGKSLRMTRKWFNSLEDESQLKILAAFHEKWEIEPGLLLELLGLKPFQSNRYPSGDFLEQRWDLRAEFG